MSAKEAIETEELLPEENYLIQSETGILVHDYFNF